MATNPNKHRHIWVYDDTAMIGPLATIDIDGKDVMIFNELLKTNRGLIIARSGAFLTVKRDVWDAIDTWADNGQFGGLDLSDYLNRMFGARI